MLKDKVILITGASKGIGAETAKLLAQEEAAVIVSYNRDKERAEDVARAINKACKGSAIALKADVSDAAGIKKLIKKIIKGFKKIDVLINNASAPIDYLPFENLLWENFQKHLDVSLRGSFNTIQNVLPYMLQRKAGKIINVLSSVTVGVPPGKPADYISAKYALLGFSKALAVELGPSGITVNCVSPGMTETDMIKGLPAKMKEVVAYQTPLKRLAKPTDIARVLLFLSSHASDYMTGCNVPVCGGNVMT